MITWQEIITLRFIARGGCLLAAQLIWVELGLSNALEFDLESNKFICCFLFTEFYLFLLYDKVQTEN
jgi:hypothetical protein